MTFIPAAGLLLYCQLRDVTLISHLFTAIVQIIAQLAKLIV